MENEEVPTLQEGIPSDMTRETSADVSIPESQKQDPNGLKPVEENENGSHENGSLSEQDGISLTEVSMIAKLMEAELVSCENEIAKLALSHRMLESADSLTSEEEGDRLVAYMEADLDNSQSHVLSKREIFTEQDIADLTALMDADLDRSDENNLGVMESLEALLTNVTISSASPIPVTVSEEVDRPKKFANRSLKADKSAVRSDESGKIVSSKCDWEEVHLFFKHLASGAAKMAAGLGDMSEKIKSLVEEDPYLFYDRLQSILFESAIELRVKILEKATPGEEFVISLLKSYDTIQEIGSRLKPHIGPLEAKFMAQIETSWDLIPKHFFYKCIFTDTRVHGLMPGTVTMLGSCDDKMGLVHELYKLDDIMSKVCDKWRHTEEKLKIYHENQLAVKLRRRLLQEEFLLYKAKKAEEEWKKNEVEKKENKQPIERAASSVDEDIPSTLDYLVTRPRGLACRNASLQDAPPQLCDRCGTAQCPCAECTVGHLLTCSLELEPEDMARELKGRTMPLEERLSLGEVQSARPQISAELSELLTQISLADYADTDSDPESESQNPPYENLKVDGRKAKGSSAKSCPDSLMKLASAKFLETRSEYRDSSPPKPKASEAIKPTGPHPPPGPQPVAPALTKKMLENRPAVTKPAAKAPPVPPKDHHHHHGHNCSHDHTDGSADSSESESTRSHCDCCHCDGTSVIRNAAMARRYPAIRQRLRNVLERRKAEKLAQQQSGKGRIAAAHSAPGSATSGVSSQQTKAPGERPVNLVKGTPHVAQSKPSLPPSKPPQQPPKSVQVAPRPQQTATKPVLTQPKPALATVPKPAHPARVQPRPASAAPPTNVQKTAPKAAQPKAPARVQPRPPASPTNVQTATPPKDIDSDKSAKIAELIRQAQQNQQAKAETSAPTVVKSQKGQKTNVQPVGKVQVVSSQKEVPPRTQVAPKQDQTQKAQSQPAPKTQGQTAPAQKAAPSQKSVPVVQPVVKETVQPEAKLQKKNKKKGDVALAPAPVEPVKTQTQAQPTTQKGRPAQPQVTVPQQKKGNQKGVKGKKGKEPPPPPPPPEPKPKSEIDQLLEFIEGEEEKPKEEKAVPVESLNEKKAAKKARQKERKQAEFITKQVEQDQVSHPADPNGMVRIVHDPVTQRAVITPVQSGYPQSHPPYPFMPMGGGPMGGAMGGGPMGGAMGGGPGYNQYPMQYQGQQGQYQGQGQYPAQQGQYQGQYQGQQGQYQGQQGQYQGQQGQQYQGQGYYQPTGPQMYPSMQQGYGGYQQQQQQAPVYQQTRPQAAPVYQQNQAASRPAPDSSYKSQGPMVTLRRVADNGPESKVTVTMKGEQPGREKVLFTLVNGHVREPKDGPPPTEPQPGEDLTKTAKKKLKKAAKHQQPQLQPPQSYPQQMPPQYPGYPPFQPSMMPSFPMPQLAPQKVEPAPRPTVSAPRPTVSAPRQRIQTVPLNDDEDFDIKSLKLPPGITVTRVLHQEGYRDPIFPQVSQMHKPSAVVQPSPQPNIIVVDTREMTGSKDCDQGKQNGAKKKKKKKRAGNSGSGQGHGEETWDADSIFAPKENPNDLDETERELEAFKRFCLDSRPADPSAKLKVNLNVKDIFSRAKNGT